MRNIMIFFSQLDTQPFVRISCEFLKPIVPVEPPPMPSLGELMGRRYL